MSESREIDRRRWRRSVVANLEDFPRQLRALSSALDEFGSGFELEAFVEASTGEDPRAYNRVQAVERGFGRIQAMVGELSEDGVKLAGLEPGPPGKGEPRVTPYFEALRDAGALPAILGRRLAALQRARNLVEHRYARVPARDVHRAVGELAELAPDFLARYAAWIEPYLRQPAR